MSKRNRIKGGRIARATSDEVEDMMEGPSKAGFYERHDMRPMKVKLHASRSKYDPQTTKHTPKSERKRDKGD